MPSERENNDQHRTQMNIQCLELELILLLYEVTQTTTAGITCVLYRKSLPKNEKRRSMQYCLASGHALHMHTHVPDCRVILLAKQINTMPTRRRREQIIGEVSAWDISITSSKMDRRQKDFVFCNVRWLFRMGRRLLRLPYIFFVN